MGGVKLGLAYVTKAGQWNAENPLHFNNKVAVSATYANGPLTAYGEYVKFDSDYSSSLAGAHSTGVYAKYNFGPVVAALGWGKVSVDHQQVAYGVSVPMGATTVGFDGVTYNGARLTEAAVKYDLSKRTSLKASYGNLNDAALSNAGYTLDSAYVSNSQYRVGLFHSF
jgi:hypothetical protein